MPRIRCVDCGRLIAKGPRCRQCGRTRRALVKPHRPEYDAPDYVRMRAALKANVVLCQWCRAERATVPDHEPPLALTAPGTWQGKLIPSCAPCNLRRTARLGR